MQATLQKIYLGVLILLSLLQLRLAHASDLEIQTFRIHVQNFEIANQDYQRAPGGSMQESQANLRRQEAAQAAKNIIRSPYAFTEMTAPVNEQLFNEFNQQYQAAPGGSLREGIFEIARRAAADGLKANAVLEIQSVGDYKQALQLTLTASQKYQIAASGSLIESVFDVVRRQGFVISKQKLQEYSQFQLQDFRQAEALLGYFNQQYQAAASGSLIENFYQEGRLLIQARMNELMRVQSAPVPPVQQTPIPGAPTCEIHSGKNASGQALFRVMDRQGRVLATVLSVQEAVQISMNDLRCRM